MSTERKSLITVLVQFGFCEDAIKDLSDDSLLLIWACHRPRPR